MKRKKESIFVVLLIVVVAIFYGVTRQSEKVEKVLITIDGTLWKEISLQEEGIYMVETEEGYNRVSVEAGKANMIEADCSDQLCVQQKEISASGEMIVCLPHRVVVEIP